METQSRVLAMLNKTKQLREARQENLGAIEDAVNQVKQDLSNKFKELTSLYDDLESATVTIMDKSKALGEDLSTSLIEIGSQWNSKLEEFNLIATELDDLGIAYEYDVDSLGSDYLQAYDVADNLMFNLGN
jgi:hypothetical protein